MVKRGLFLNKGLFFLEIACCQGGKESPLSDFTIGQTYANFGQNFAFIWANFFVDLGKLSQFFWTNMHLS